MTTALDSEDAAAAVARFRDRSGGFACFVDTFLEKAEREGFDGAAEIAALERAGLRPRLEPVFDITDCGPRNRYAVLARGEPAVVGSGHGCEKESYWDERGAGRTTGRATGENLSRVQGLPRPAAGGRPDTERKNSPAPPREGDPGGESGADAAKLIIVSNCAYGAVASTIERRIEAVTGIKPEEGTGEALLAALEKRQPDVFSGLEQVAKAPANGETLRAASGRLRRFPVHGSNLSGISWRVKKAYLRAMGNEARNFFPQESVAATLARACRWLNDWYRKSGMQARACIGLYDSVLTHCPEEERFVCAEAHEVFMHRVNFWRYGPRYMNYPIDTEHVYRWSYKPSKAQKAHLENKQANVMDPERSARLIGDLHALENRIFGAQPWVLERLNKAEVVN